MCKKLIPRMFSSSTTIGKSKKSSFRSSPGACSKDIREGKRQFPEWTIFHRWLKTENCAPKNRDRFWRIREGWVQKPALISRPLSRCKSLLESSTIFGNYDHSLVTKFFVKCQINHSVRNHIYYSFVVPP